MMEFYRSFTTQEMRCQCCGAERMDPGFMEKLQAARDVAGIPFRINSAYRCEKHNAIVGGVSGSSHLRGCAADIHTATSVQRLYIVDALCRAGFQRIGIAKNFIHVDNDNTKPRSMWLY